MAATGDWSLVAGPNAEFDDALTDALVAYNKHASVAVCERFRPENVKSRPVGVYAIQDGELVGGCVGRTEDVWQWLTIDTMWVVESLRGQGLGIALLDWVEREAKSRGCRWSMLNTFDFQAPGFYRKAGYVEFGRQDNYPPGHTNFYLRKDL